MNQIPDIYANGNPPQELFYISSIDNVASILEHGILSHKRVSRLLHDDISNESVQERRAYKVVPNAIRDALKKKALTIHQHANLYLRAHNSMLYVKRDLRDTLCVLRIDPRILNRDEVVVSDRNAAKNDANFENAQTFKFSPDSAQIQLERLSIVFSDKVTHKADKRKAVLQAEVLIPYEIHPSYVRGIYVANTLAGQALINRFPQGLPVPIDIHPSLFFSAQTTKTDDGFNPLSRIAPQPLSNTVYPDLVEDSPESSDDDETMDTTAMFDIEDVYPAE